MHGGSRLRCACHDVRFDPVNRAASTWWYVFARANKQVFERMIDHLYPVRQALWSTRSVVNDRR